MSEALYTEHTAASETLHIRPLFNLQTVLDRLRCVVALVVYSVPHLGLPNSIVLFSTCILNTHYGVTSRFCAFLFNMIEKTNFTQSYYTLLFVASWTLTHFIHAAQQGKKKRTAWRERKGYREMETSKTPYG